MWALSRVRDLFRQAKDKAPCIIFIDEIDAIGRARGKNNIVGGNDGTRKYTEPVVGSKWMVSVPIRVSLSLQQPTVRIVFRLRFMVRPGRFDWQVSFDKPDLIGREQIFKVHLKPVKLADGVDAKKIIGPNPGALQALRIANVCNEAALIAARKNKEAVDMQDFHDAIDRVIGGLEKKNKDYIPLKKNVS